MSHLLPIIAYSLLLFYYPFQISLSRAVLARFNDANGLNYVAMNVEMARLHKH
jgi:hypothetical protein